MARFASIGKVGTPWSFCRPQLQMNAVGIHTSVFCRPQLHMRAPVFTIYNKFSTRPKGTFLDRRDVLNRVLTCVKSFEKVDSSLVTEDTHFIKDLGVDSLDAVEIVMAFEDEFIVEIPDDEADKIQSVKDAVDYISSLPNAN